MDDKQRLSRRQFMRLSALVTAGALTAACEVPTAPPAGDQTAEPAAEDTPQPQDVAAQLFILSNSSPHISVIDTSTHEIVETADIPDFTSWTWNDDNNHADGENLWLGTKDQDTNEVEVVTLNMDSLEIDNRFPIGEDELTLYIGKATSDGIVHAGKMGSGQVAAIDTANLELLDIWDVPVSGDVVCDADVAVDADGVERFYYPTRNGDTLISIDAHTGETGTIVDTPEGSTPLMLTTAPDNTVWVQEVDSNTNGVFDPTTLELVNRFLTGEGPVVASFSKDGSLGYIGHSRDTVVTVVDAATYEEIATVEAGTNPQKLGVHPNGRYVYAILTQEAAVAVIDTESWQVTQRIDLGTNPTGIYVREQA